MCRKKVGRTLLSQLFFLIGLVLQGGVVNRTSLVVVLVGELRTIVVQGPTGE